VYQQEQPLQFHIDGFYRREWTRDFFGDAPDDSGWRLQARPRLEFGTETFQLGVGGDFNYSGYDNTEPLDGETEILLQRDNFASRDARLDLAFAKIDPVDFLRIEGGRFFLPIVMTEMIWDEDIRPQGAALHLMIPAGQTTTFRGTGLWSKGAHVFDDDRVTTTMLAGAFEGESYDFGATWLRFDDIDELDPSLIRQNSRDALGRLLYDRYQVFDFVLRLRHSGNMPAELVGNYAWNSEADDDNKGYWARLRLGSLVEARGMLEYTYADVDRDATLAAYATDDFIWSTGWKGHRAVFSVKSTPNSSIRLLAQWQRFKAAPNPEAREHWVKRYRIDFRLDY
jgi:hypothetical protein